MRAVSRHAVPVIVAGLALLIAACTLLSGTDDLRGGVCKNCPAGRKLACGASFCDTSREWCCMSTAQAISCGDPCPPATSAITCFSGSDCSPGTTCCLFLSNHQGQAEERRFSQCQPACGPNDETVCQVDAGPSCPAGKQCVPAGIGPISVCR